jgi:outer membrane biosynthesis protein TonB
VKGEDVTIGSQLDATFGVNILERNASGKQAFTVAHYKKDGQLLLHVPAEASGLVWIGSEAYNVDHLRHKDKATSEFGDIKLKLKVGDRADLVFGELTLSFRFVHPPEKRVWNDFLPVFDKVFMRISGVMLALFVLLALYVGLHKTEVPELTLDDLPKDVKKAMFNAQLSRQIRQRHSAIGELAKDHSGGRAGGEEGKASANKRVAETQPNKAVAPAKRAMPAEPPKDKAHFVKGHKDKSRFNLAQAKAQPKKAKTQHKAAAMAQPAPKAPKPKAEPKVDLDSAFSAGPKAPKNRKTANAAAPSSMDAAGNTVAALTDGGSFARGRKGSGGGGAGQSVGIGSLTGYSTGGGMGASDYGLVKTKGKEIRSPEGEELVILGGLDRDIIAAIIRRYLPQIQHCYEQGLVHNSKLKGKVMVAFVISGQGGVQSAEVAESSLRSPATEKCMISKIMGWKFPKPRGGGTVGVRYPFLLMSSSNK